MQSDYNSDQGLTRDRLRCDRNFIICGEPEDRGFPKQAAKAAFPHQIPETTRRQVHGETMSIGALRSAERRAWSVQQRSGGRAFRAGVQQHGGTRERRARLILEVRRV